MVRTMSPTALRIRPTYPHLTFIFCLGWMAWCRHHSWPHPAWSLRNQYESLRGFCKAEESTCDLSNRHFYLFIIQSRLLILLTWNLITIRFACIEFEVRLALGLRFISRLSEEHVCNLFLICSLHFIGLFILFSLCMCFSLRFLVFLYMTIAAWNKATESNWMQRVIVCITHSVRILKCAVAGAASMWLCFSCWKRKISRNCRKSGGTTKASVSSSPTTRSVALLCCLL